MGSLGLRLSGTVVIGVGWSVFILLWLAFYAGGFGFWQNLAIFIVSVIIACGLIAIMWIQWALR